MGKHERKLIQEAENLIVKILKGQATTSDDECNKWYSYAFEIAQEIKKDITTIRRIEHVGNRYDLIGDLIINDGSKDIFIEVKMSEKPSGKCTKANISQNALTELGLFKGDLKSWSEFRELNCHQKLISSLLSSYEHIPDEIKGPNMSSNIIKEKIARYIRNKSRNGELKAKRILNAIHGVDKVIKLKYLSYLSEKPQDEDKIKRFYILIMLGIHKIEKMRELMKKRNLINQAKNLLVYYGNKENQKIIVTKEDVGEKVNKIMNKVDKFKIFFKEGQTNCKLVGISKGKIVPLLNIVLHWKNIAQGIKTPCLNIFDITPDDL